MQGTDGEVLWKATNCLAHTDKSTAIIRFWWEFGMLLLGLLQSVLERTGYEDWGEENNQTE